MPDLPDMLRDENPMCERRSATPEEWQANGKWALYPIGPELAALVEAADEFINSGPWPDTIAAYIKARAALAAKIGAGNA